MEQHVEQQEQNDKISKQFESNFKKLVALIGGEKNFKKPKVAKDEVGGIIESLISERKQAVIKQFTEQAIVILDKKVEFDKEVKKAEEELKKSVLAKKKEFSEKMKSLFDLVESIEEIEKSYYISLKEVTNDSTEK